jgi:serine/threonine-protein kinase
MFPCRSCGEGIPENSRFCPQCGASLVAETMVTAAISGPADMPPRPPSRTPSSSSSLDEGRFLPGTLLVGRYRVVALLGRGGMGEVYRANDLRLGQPVALKFLPEETAKNETALARFYNEVRIARQVSHPNVCRVYDLGDVEGQPYLSMEYVDGEDLGSLLRRIGRLPEVKALEIARKLRAGAYMSRFLPSSAFSNREPGTRLPMTPVVALLNPASYSCTGSRPRAKSFL